MEIVKYIKVIVPRLSSTKKVLRNKLWHMLAGIYYIPVFTWRCVTNTIGLDWNDRQVRQKYRRVSVCGLIPASPPANFAYAWETTQDMSSLVMGFGAPPENGFSEI